MSEDAPTTKTPNPDETPTLEIKERKINRILIADDYKELRETLEELLQYMGYEVTAVASGMELLQEVAGGGFDLVITDYNMPTTDGENITGVEALQTIRKTEAIKNLPVIVFTGDIGFDIPVNVKNNGGVFVSKGREDDLLNAIEKIEKELPAQKPEGAE